MRPEIEETGLIIGIPVAMRLTGTEDEGGIREEDDDTASEVDVIVVVDKRSWLSRRDDDASLLPDLKLPSFWFVLPMKLIVFPVVQ